MTLPTIINQRRGQSNSHLMVHVTNLKQWSNQPTPCRLVFFFFGTFWYCENIERPTNKLGERLRNMSNDDFIRRYKNTDTKIHIY